MNMVGLVNVFINKISILSHSHDFLNVLSVIS